MGDAFWLEFFIWIIRSIWAMPSARDFVVWIILKAMSLLLKLLGRVPSGRASTDYATLQNILRMVPLRVLRIPRAILFLGWNIFRAMPSAWATPGSLHSVFAAQRTKPCASLSHFYYVLHHNRLSRLVKPAWRRPHSGKAQIKNKYKIIKAMPSARALCYNIMRLSLKSYILLPNKIH